ncbi:MAG TPA: trehalose-phosphatase [Pseudolabrys sp.]|nr:trehalose-phosphatase [Pseudolabrys sp.]
MQTIANDPVMDVFAKLDLRTVALLLDVDGTIIDIAPSPTEVQVSDALLQSLRHLFDLTGGAVALVSGRPINDLDRLFAPLRLPAIGGHGAEMRLSDNQIFYWARPLPQELRQRLADTASLGSGIIVEDKNYSLALHYRNAPTQAERIRRHIATCRTAFADEPTELLLGKALFEVKRPGIDKGESIRKLMAYPPFSGRTPVFIGDDITDESVFEVLPDIGGKGFSVSRHFPGLTGIFKNPSQVRSALQTLAANRRARS